MSMELVTDVLIVGAGVAGMTAAMCLKERTNLKFLVVEGRQRIGGRIDLIDFNGFSFAAGPMFVHGRKGNPISDIIEELKMTIYPQDWSSFGSKSFIVRSTACGEDISTKFVETLNKYKYASELLFDDKFEEIVDKPLSAEMICYGWDPISAIERTQDSLANDLYNGTSAHNISTLAERKCDLLNDDEIEILLPEPDGYLQILNYFALKANLLLEDGSYSKNLCLSTFVEDINWGSCSQDGYARVFCVSTNNTNERYCLKAKFIIITVPPILLLECPQSKIQNYAGIKFHPSLPPQKQRVLSLIEMSNMCRIFVAYKRRFWDPVDVIIRVDEKNGLDMPWHGNASHPARNLIYWQNLSNFMPDLKDCAILSGFVAGYWADHYLTLSAADLETEVTDVLSSIYPSFSSEAKHPINVKIVNWEKDPFSLGSYPYVMLGLTPDLVNWISSPCLSPLGSNLYFAGDGYSLKYLGTVQGAYDTAINAVEDIIKALKLMP